MRKLKRRGLLVLLTAIVISAFAFVPSYAADNSNIISITPNKTAKYQLDGRGAKEKIKLVTKDKEIEPFEKNGWQYNHAFTVTLKINEKTIYNNSYNYYSWGQDSGLKTELILTDVNKNDKAADLFLGVYDQLWYGTYQDLIRRTYNKDNRIVKDQLIKTLRAIKSPKCSSSYLDMSGRGYMLNPLESHVGLAKGDMVVLGNGKIQWNVCLYTGTPGGDYVHSYITLYLKSGKLKAEDYPSGVSGLDSSGGTLIKNLAVYKSPKSSRKAATIKK